MQKQISESMYPVMVGELDNLRRDQRYRVEELSTSLEANVHLYFCDEFVSAHKTLVSACAAANVLRTKHENS